MYWEGDLLFECYLVFSGFIIFFLKENYLYLVIVDLLLNYLVMINKNYKIYDIRRVLIFINEEYWYLVLKVFLICIVVLSYMYRMYNVYLV